MNGRELIVARAPILYPSQVCCLAAVVGNRHHGKQNGIISERCEDDLIDFVSCALTIFLK